MPSTKTQTALARLADRTDNAQTAAAIRALAARGAATRARAAAALGRSRTDAALQALALAATDRALVVEAARGLGASKHPRATRALLAVLARRSALQVPSPWARYQRAARGVSRAERMRRYKEDSARARARNREALRRVGALAGALVQRGDDAAIKRLIAIWSETSNWHVMRLCNPLIAKLARPQDRRRAIATGLTAPRWWARRQTGVMITDDPALGLAVAAPYFTPARLATTVGRRAAQVAVEVFARRAPKTGRAAWEKLLRRALAVRVLRDKAVLALARLRTKSAADAVVAQLEAARGLPSRAVLQAATQLRDKRVPPLVIAALGRKKALPRYGVWGFYRIVVEIRHPGLRDALEARAKYLRQTRRTAELKYLRYALKQLPARPAAKKKKAASATARRRAAATPRVRRGNGNRGVTTSLAPRVPLFAAPTAVVETAAPASVVE